MMVKSPLKWVGSKSRLMAQLLPHLPKGKRLIEPFAGSCSVMMNTDYEEYLIADLNPDLISFYQAAAGNTDDLIERAKSLFAKFNTEHGYYDSRDCFNDDPDDEWRPALFLFLNRHCFNGLCRYNKSGKFNTPYGRYKAPYFPEAELKAFAEKAKRATFVCANYSQTLDMARDDDDVIYCDPPYLTESANFTAYHSQGFTAMDHGRLARRLRRIAGRGISVVASNSDLDTVHSLYAGFECVSIDAPRSVGAAAKSQKVAKELIIKSSRGDGASV